jgi:hypothetical protein
MLTRRHIFAFVAGLAVLMARPALAQVAPSAEGGATQQDDTEMMTPPPVSGMPYPQFTADDTQTNDLDASVAFTPAYVDNILPGETSTTTGGASAPISDETYSIVPSISYNRLTTRQTAEFVYTPNFIFYQPTSNEPTSSLDSIDQSATLEFEYRLKPQVGLAIEDTFLRTHNVFNESYSFSTPVTGSTLASTPGVIAPFAEQLTNSTNGVLSYQFGQNAMVGGGGSYSLFDLSDTVEASTGLYNSNSTGGMAFYSRRISSGQYLGVAYQYGRILTYPVGGVDETQTHALLPFYTLYIKRGFSFSVSAGAQHIADADFQGASSNSWTPIGVTSMSWQGSRGRVAANYSRMVTSGNGVIGAYYSNAVITSGDWDITHTWIADVSFGYVSINTVSSQIKSTFPQGDSITGQAALEHSFGEHFRMTLGYQHLHENYSDLGFAIEDPDSNREYGTITYEFRRPLGR